MEKKSKAILFGTGEGGKNGFKHLRKKCEILGFADNDTQKQGHSFMGLPVYSPADLENMAFDQIVICSQYQDEIQDQLNLQLNIPFEKIDILDPDIRVYGSGNLIGCLIVIIGILAAVIFGVWKLVSWFTG